MRNLKKLLALVLAVTMALSLVLPALAKTIDDFADKDAAAKALADKENLELTYGSAVQLMIDLEVMIGKPGNILDLDKTLTRAEFLVMLYKLNSGGEPISANYENMPAIFSDTDDWMKGYCNWAGATGVSAGIGGGLFAPDRPITFIEALLLCMKAIGLITEAGGEPNFEFTSFKVLSLANEIGILGDLYPMADGTSIDRAAACLLFQYTLLADRVVYLYGTNNSRFRDREWGNTFARTRFGLVGGDFLVISDGTDWGMPHINEVVCSVVSDGSGISLPVNNGGLSEGRAVIQRPYQIDRKTGKVIAWDTYILSAKDTKAMKIGLHDIGRSIWMLFRHPDREYWSKWTGTEDTYGLEWRPGEYHRKDIEKVIASEWLSDVDLIHGVEKLDQANLGGALPGNSRIFVDYTNEYTNDNDTGNGLSYKTSDGLKNYTNADIYVITSKETGKIEWVFIEDYKMAKVADIEDDWIRVLEKGVTIGGTSGIGTGSRKLDWRTTEDTDYPEKGDYLGVCGVRMFPQWRDLDWDTGFIWKMADHAYEETGRVTAVTGDADVIEGAGTLTLDGKLNYRMLPGSFSGNWINSFKTAIVTLDRTLTMWHGFIIDVSTPSVPTQYCLITAAGVERVTSYNTNTWTYKVDVMYEDGTETAGLVIDKIYMTNIVGSNLMQATALPPGATPSAGQYGTFSDLNGAPIFFQSTSGQDVFGSLKQLKEHIFRYTISAGKITLYEVNAQQKAGDKLAPAAGRLQATSGGRFNPTWGPTLGKTIGMNNTEGLMMLEDAVVFVKTVDAAGKAYFNVYNQSIPGFDGVTAYSSETLLTPNGNPDPGGNGYQKYDNDGNGAFVRVGFIDVGGARSQNIRTRWAVALDWWKQNENPGSMYSGTVKAMNSAGEEVTLTCRDEYTTNGTAFRIDGLRRGDVFLYESTDGTPNTITNVTLLYSDATVHKYTAKGLLSVFEVKDEDNATGVDDVYYGTSGNNHFMVDATGSKHAGRAGLAAVDTWGIDGSGAWNLYIFDASRMGTEYVNMTQILVVKRPNDYIDSQNSSNSRFKDNRGIEAKKAALISAITAANLTALVSAKSPADLTAAKLAVKGAVDSAILSILTASGGPGPAVYVDKLTNRGTPRYEDGIQFADSSAVGLVTIDQIDFRIAGIPFKCGAPATAGEVNIPVPFDVLFGMVISAGAVNNDSAANAGGATIEEPFINAEGAVEFNVTGAATEVDDPDAAVSDTFDGCATSDGFIIIGIDLEAMLEALGYTTRPQVTVVQENAALLALYPGEVAFQPLGVKTKTYAAGWGAGSQLIDPNGLYNLVLQQGGGATLTVYLGGAVNPAALILKIVITTDGLVIT